VFGRDASHPVKQALENGVLHIDTAQMYKNEDTVGVAIREYLDTHQALPRSSLFITTKLANLPQDGSVLESLQTSLSKLQLDYVDLFLIHFPTFFEGRLPQVWREMEQVKKLGLARSIGVSNWRVDDFAKILPGAEILPAVNQIEFHPGVLHASLPLLEIHKKYKIMTASYGGLSPLFRAEGNPLSAQLAMIRARLSVTDAQILQLWLIAKGSLAVTTTSKTQRVLDSLAVPELTPLTVEEIKSIDAGIGKHQRYFAKHMDD